MTTPIADMVAQMLSADIPADMIVLAVRTAEMRARPSTASDPEVERRRELDRERKRRVRGTSRSTISVVSKPSTEEEKEKKKERAKRDRGQKLPEDWTPTPKHFEDGAKIGFSTADVLSQAEDLRIWARANEHRAVARKSDWGLTFSGWMRRNKPKGFVPPPEPTPTAQAGFYAAENTPELDAWDAHHRATKGINAPRDRKGGWRFPSRWPPGHEQQGQAA